MPDLQRPNIGTYFAVAEDTPCGICGEVIAAGDTAIWDADDRLCGYECGCGDPHFADQ